MAQIQKAEGQIELKCSANEFFHIWAHKTYEVNKMCPLKFPKIELNEGNWGKVGCVINWQYVANGMNELVKTQIAEIDENNKSVTYNSLDGPIVKNYYKSFKTKIQIIPHGNNNNKKINCIVKWTINYEKMNEDAPDADVFVDFLLGVAQEMDAHLCTTA